MPYYYIGEIMFDKDVPIPAATRGAMKYPFCKLVPDVSAFHACADTQEKRKARRAAYELARNNKWKIVVRSFPDGVRVWRLA